MSSDALESPSNISSIAPTMRKEPQSSIFSCCMKILVE
jgi:hypothetical protein